MGGPFLKDFIKYLVFLYPKTWCFLVFKVVFFFGVLRFPFGVFGPKLSGHTDDCDPNYKQTKQTITKQKQITIDFQLFFQIDRRHGRPFRKKIERKNERYINKWVFCTSEMICNSLNLDAYKNPFSKKQKEAFSMAAALNLVSLGSKLRDVALDRIAKATVKTQDLKREAQNSF